MHAMGLSLAIGVLSAIAMSLLTTLLVMVVGVSALSQLNSAGNLSSVLKNSGISSTVSGTNFFQLIMFMMAMGVSGLFSVSASISGMSLGGLGVSASGYIWFPITLTGIALLLGTAFGAYFLAHRSPVRFVWTGVASSGVVGLIAGLTYLLLTSLFSLSSSSSVQSVSAQVQIHGNSLRTFAMAFLLACLGALIGYALSDAAPEGANVFHAAWLWAHRTRGFARTCIESLAIYSVVFTTLAVIALIVVSITSGHAQIILFFPLLLPALPLLIFALSSFGAIEVVATGQTTQTSSLFNTSFISDGGWSLWLGFLVFLLSTLYIALRASARNLYDKQYAQWPQTWKAPVAIGVSWILFQYLAVNSSAGVNAGALSQLTGSSSSAQGIFSFGLQPWYFLLIGLWAFAIEAIAMTFGPTLVISMPKIWSWFVGGTVRPSSNTSGTALLAQSAITTASAPTAQQQFTQTTAPIAAADPTRPTSLGTPVMPVPATTPAAMQTAATARPLSASQRRIILLVSLIVGIGVVLGIAYTIASNTIFSAQNVANTYMSDIASGHYDKATALANPHLSSAKAALLTDEAASGKNTTIYNQKVTGTRHQSDGSTSVDVSYMLNGQTYYDALTISPSGSKFVIFKNWNITTPLIKKVSIEVPSAVSNITVNNVTVSTKNSAEDNSSDDEGTTLTLNAYPGTYIASLPHSDYLSASPVTLRATTTYADPQILHVKTTQKLSTAITNTVREKIDACAKSTDANPKGCPFGFGSFYSNSELANNYRNFAWSITTYPTIDYINLSSKTFYLSSGDARVSYDDKFLDDWTPEKSDDYFDVSGTFTISGNTVRVTIQDPSSDYSDSSF